jgi:hypothetical protein
MLSRSPDFGPAYNLDYAHNSVGVQTDDGKSSLACHFNEWILYGLNSTPDICVTSQTDLELAEVRKRLQWLEEENRRLCLSMDTYRMKWMNECRRADVLRLRLSGSGEVDTPDISWWMTASSPRRNYGEQLNCTWMRLLLADRENADSD